MAAARKTSRFGDTNGVRGGAGKAGLIPSPGAGARRSGGLGGLIMAWERGSSRSSEWTVRRIGDAAGQRGSAEPDAASTENWMRPGRPASMFAGMATVPGTTASGGVARGGGRPAGRGAAGRAGWELGVAVLSPVHWSSGRRTCASQSFGGVEGSRPGCMGGASARSGPVSHSSRRRERACTPSRSQRRSQEGGRRFTRVPASRTRGSGVPGPRPDSWRPAGRRATATARRSAGSSA